MTEDIPIKYIAGLDAYQDEAFKTAVFPTEVGSLYCALGVLGEAGEMGEVILSIIDRAASDDPGFMTKDMKLIRSAVSKTAEAAKIVEVFKKKVRKKHLDLKPMPELTDDERDRIRSEGGDGLWYAGALATVTGWKLSEVAQQNIKKLRGRRDAGVIASAGETIEERELNK